MKTKKAKTVKVSWTKRVYTVLDSEYQCPSCRTFFKNSVSEKVTRFICNCGQELIVENVYPPDPF